MSTIGNTVFLMNNQVSLQYKNTYLNFSVISPDGDDGKTVAYCSGVNIDRFLPLTRGRHRAMANPAIRGLQLVNHEVRSLILSRGATPRALQAGSCPDIVSPGECWYSEAIEIQNASAKLTDEIIQYGPVTLVKKIIRALMLNEQLPDSASGPVEMQAYLDALCTKYGNQ